MLTRRAVILAKIEQVESTLQGGSTDTLIVLNAGASSVNNYYRGWDMKISGETRTIISYNGSSKTATVNLAYTSAPLVGVTYLINSYGVDPTPQVANVILCTVPNVRIEGKELTRDYVRDTLSKISHSIGDKEVEVTFDTELKGAGSVGTAPEIGVLLRMCAMGQTIVSGISVAYTPISDFMESGTIYVYKDGVLHKVSGCVGDWKASLVAGEYGKVSWTFRGKYAAPETAAVPSTTANATLPPTVTNAALTVSGYSPIASKLDIELNNAIAKRMDMNQLDAVKGFFITGRDPGGTIDPEACTLGEKNFWTDWANSYAQEVSITISGAVGNVVQITSSGMVLNAPAYGERDGILTYDIPFKLVGDDNEFSIVFK